MASFFLFFWPSWLPVHLLYLSFTCVLLLILFFFSLWACHVIVGLVHVPHFKPNQVYTDNISAPCQGFAFGPVVFLVTVTRCGLSFKNNSFCSLSADLSLRIPFPPSFHYWTNYHNLKALESFFQGNTPYLLLLWILLFPWLGPVTQSRHLWDT